MIDKMSGQVIFVLLNIRIINRTKVSDVSAVTLRDKGCLRLLPRLIYTFVKELPRQVLISFELLHRPVRVIEIAHLLKVIS